MIRGMLAGLLLLAGAMGQVRAEDRQPIRIAIVSRTVFYLPVWLAERRGYFRDEGLDATVEVFDSAERINAALRDGSIQIAVSTPESIMTDALHGGRLRVVAGNAGRLPHFIITRPEIGSIAELRGKTIGVLSSEEGTTHLVPQMALSAGLNPGDYTIKPVGGAPTRWRLLQSGQIDAGMQPFPLSYEAEAAGFNNLGPLAAFVPDWQFTSVNVDDGWAESHRTVLVGALRALRRGLDDIAADPDGAAAVAVEELRTSKALAERTLADTARMGILTPGMDVTIPGLERVHAALVAAKLVPDRPFSAAQVTDLRFLRDSRDIVLRGQGSFMAGGTQAAVTGQGIKEVRVAAGAPPVRTDPNGTYQTGQAYVQWERLAHPTGLPVLFLNGGTATGAMWETTPDGRPGWRDIFLHEGHDVWQVDAPGKGRAGYQPFPAVLPGEPVFRSNEATWMLLRMGRHYDPDPSKRQAFPRSQFPIDSFDGFMKGAVPRFAGQDDVELASYGAIIDRACPCVIVAQSSGAYFATVLAARYPDLVRGVVAAELTVTMDPSQPDAAALARVPQLLIWGDNLQATEYWRKTRAAADAYAAALHTMGARVDVLDLPELGQTGNTHQLMMDRNSEFVAEQVVEWLRAHAAAQ